MKKSLLYFWVLVIFLMQCLLLTGCEKYGQFVYSVTNPGKLVTDEAEEIDTQEENLVEDKINIQTELSKLKIDANASKSEEATNDSDSDVVVCNDDVAEVVNDDSEEAVSNSNADENESRSDLVESAGGDGSKTSPTEEDKNQEKVHPANPAIVWLGDSLTQGSLGDDNDNLSGAPFVILSNKYDLDVEGYGYYGNNTHDILWRYTDETQENQKVDAEKIYIFWVGSNDWVIGGMPNTNTSPVIDEIDRFLAKGPVEKYIVIGTTARYELWMPVEGTPMYGIINNALKGHYTNHYLDVQNSIGENGFGPDMIHLQKESYERVARAVYDKLRMMGYIY